MKSQIARGELKADAEVCAYVDHVSIYVHAHVKSEVVSSRPTQRYAYTHLVYLHKYMYMQIERGELKAGGPTLHLIPCF